MFLRMEYVRYSRQTTLPEIGQGGQETLSKASVLVIGAGGLGCPALLYLVAAGIGRIGIMDGDVVEETNLHRQVLYTPEDIGAHKAYVAQSRLEALNPETVIDVYVERLTVENAEVIISQYEYVLDGTDNFKSKFLINDVCLKTNTPFVYGSVLGFEGQVAVFNHEEGACYRCLFPHAPAQNVPNCAEAGVIGAVAGIMGTIQAMELVKLIVNHDSFKPVANAVLTFDMRTMRSKIISLPKQASCLCSQNVKEIQLEKGDPMIDEILPEDAVEKQNTLLVDVREQDEWDAGHIKGAEFFPLSRLMDGDMPSFPKDQDIVLYCRSGKRSLNAAHILKAHGYENLYNMTGGYLRFMQLPAPQSSAAE